MSSVAPQYHSDLWSNQESRVFCIVEKEALIGVLKQTCENMDVPLLAARGYPSISVLREFAENEIIPRGVEQYIEIIHLGDHDPSGIDMSRDLEDRLAMLCGGDLFTLTRIALNMDQITNKKCPPNPAKLTDSRSSDYIKRYGKDSWELDALEPSYLVNLVQNAIESHIDQSLWGAREKEIADAREELISFADTL
jgi:hypothetical protein